MDENTQLEPLLSLPEGELDTWLGEHRGRLDGDTVAALRARAEEVGYAGDLAGALRILDRAERVARALDDPLPLGLVWRGRASVLQRHDRFVESLAACREAAALYERHGTDFDVAVARTVEVYVLGALERFDEAIELAGWIRPIFVREGFTRGEAYVTYNLARVYTWAWRHEDALHEYRQARRLYRQLGNSTETTAILHDMGVVADQIDRLDLARRWYTRAYPALVAAGDALSIIKTQYNLALLCLRQGQYEEALAHLDRARADLGRLPELPDVAYVDLFEARVRRALDQPARAEDLLRQALATFERENRRIESAETLAELAHLLAERPSPESLARGLACLERAEAYLQDLDVPLLLAWTRLAEGEFLLRLQRAAEAAGRAQAAHDAFAPAGLHLRAAQAQALLADCAWRSRPEDARSRYRAALDGAGEDVPLLAARCWRGLGRLAAAAGDTDAAEQAYERAIALLETVRRALHGHRHQAGFLEGRRELTGELLAALHARPHGEARVLAWVERFKAGALADLLAGQPPDSTTTPELAHLLEEREQLRGELDRHLSPLVAGASAPVAEMPQRGPALAAHDAYQAGALADVRRRLQELEERIARRHDRACEWRRGAAIDPPKVHHLLDEGTALVSYYAAGGHLYALTATQARGDLQIHPLHVSPGEVEERWRQARRRVARPAARVADVQARLAYFWDVLLAPLERRLRASARLLILPHRGLFHVPFAALYDAGDGRYLLERWTVQLAPSATILARCRGWEQGTRPPLLAGYPGQPDRPGYLPGVEREIRALSGLLPGLDVLFGERATASDVMAAAPGRAFLHLAGHAFYDSTDPLESGMPLAGGRWLRAADLYHRHGHLAGATVVLSGCSAGRGRPTGGDVLGLTSAFLYAGAAGILAGLWRVDDAATAGLMAAFYRELGRGADAVGALRRAQLDLLRGERYAHPYYWAPFALSGDSRALLNSPEANED